MSPEFCANMSAAMRGRPKSQEHVRSVRIAQLSPELVAQYPEKLPPSVVERRRYLKKHYGLTEDQYNEMVASQNGRCAICATDSPGKRRWHVDHCHKTGKIRGLLCGLCNSMLGCARDNPETLKGGIEYLSRTSAC